MLIKGTWIAIALLLLTLFSCKGMELLQGEIRLDHSVMESSPKTDAPMTVATLKAIERDSSGSSLSKLHNI